MPEVQFGTKYRLISVQIVMCLFLFQFPLLEVELIWSSRAGWDFACNCTCICNVSFAIQAAACWLQGRGRHVCVNYCKTMCARNHFCTAGIVSTLLPIWGYALMRFWYWQRNMKIVMWLSVGFFPFSWHGWPQSVLFCPYGISGVALHLHFEQNEKETGVEPEVDTLYWLMAHKCQESRPLLPLVIAHLIFYYCIMVLAGLQKLKIFC